MKKWFLYDAWRSSLTSKHRWGNRLSMTMQVCLGLIAGLNLHYLMVKPSWITLPALIWVLLVAVFVIEINAAFMTWARQQRDEAGEKYIELLKRTVNQEAFCRMLNVVAEDSGCNVVQAGSLQMKVEGEKLIVVLAEEKGRLH